MSISDGQPVNGASVNAAFGSKSADNTFVGNQNLNKVGSGPQVPDVQQAINNSFWQTTAEEDIANGGTVTSDINNKFQYRRIKASLVATHILSVTPFGVLGTWSDGMVIRLVCTSDTEKIQITHNDIQYGAILMGDAEFTRFSTMDLQYDSVLERWLEVGRSI